MTTMMQIKKRVTVALDEDERLEDYSLQVIDETGSGMITLKGRVGSAEDRETAEKIARRQEGVVKVINDLVVEPEDEALDIAPPVILGKSTNS